MSKKSSYNNKDSMPSFGDPYQILNIEFGATDEEISKAYRRLALKYHPDKQRQRQNANPNDTLTAAEIQSRFHNLTEAKSFLLDAEHREARRKYDSKRRSDIARKKDDELREQNMSARRKRMRDELLAKEKRASGMQSKVQKQVQTFYSGGTNVKANATSKEQMEKLKREGIRIREKYESKAENLYAQKFKDEKKKLQDRQIRLKWSRSRISVSHSEESIARLLKKFGEIEAVELIGAKGNAALVTFTSAFSCGPCVEAYLESEEMRATFVGERKRNEQQKAATASLNENNLSRSHDFENMKERSLRQAEEREALLREMELNDLEPSTTKNTVNQSKKHNMKPQVDANNNRAMNIAQIYPPKFPMDDLDGNLTPFERLEKLEKIVLPLCVSTK